MSLKSVKKGQHRQSSSHSDLYTDENPKRQRIEVWNKRMEKSVSKINGSGKSLLKKILVEQERKWVEITRGVYRHQQDEEGKRNEMTNSPLY